MPIDKRETLSEKQTRFGPSRQQQHSYVPGANGRKHAEAALLPFPSHVWNQANGYGSTEEGLTSSATINTSIVVAVLTLVSKPRRKIHHTSSPNTAEQHLIPPPPTSNGKRGDGNAYYRTSKISPTMH
ncbi:unnamed protein product [Ectocarpus sp. 12 AP-2014]